MSSMGRARPMPERARRRRPAPITLANHAAVLVRSGSSSPGLVLPQEGREALARRLARRQGGLNFGEHARLLQRFAAAAHDAGQRVVRNVDRELGLLLQAPVNAAQEGAAAGETDALE